MPTVLLSIFSNEKHSEAPVVNDIWHSIYGYIYYYKSAIAVVNLNWVHSRLTHISDHHMTDSIHSLHPHQNKQTTQHA